MPVDNAPAADNGVLSAEDIATHKARLSSESETDVLESIQFFRKKLSIVADPPISAIVDADLLPEFIRLLKSHGATQVRYEAAWCLTNVASGASEMTRAVVDAGAVPIFASLISLETATSKDKDTVQLCEQCVWAVGNICGDGPAMRDLAIREGLPEKLSDLLELVGAPDGKVFSERPALLRNLTWSSSNLFRGKPKPAYSAEMARVAHALARLVSLPDDEARTDVLWGLSYAAEIDPDGAEEVARSADLVVVTALAGDADADSKLRIPAMRLLGNLVSCPEHITQAVVDAGGVDAFYGVALSKDEKKSLKKEALWALSNVAAGTKEQSMAVALHPQMQALCSLIPTLPSDLLKEGLWIVANACQSKDTHIVDAVIAGGGMAALISGLKLDDVKAKLVALEGIECMLGTPTDDPRAGAEGGNGPRSDAVEAAGGLGAIEALQHHPSEEVYRRAHSMLVNYFAAEADDEDEEGGEHPYEHPDGQAQPIGAAFAALQLDESSDKIDNLIDD